MSIKSVQTTITSSASYTERLTISKVAALPGHRHIVIESFNHGAKNPSEPQVRHQVTITQKDLERVASAFDNATHE